MRVFWNDWQQNHETRSPWSNVSWVAGVHATRSVAEVSKLSETTSQPTSFFKSPQNCEAVRNATNYHDAIRQMPT